MSHPEVVIDPAIPVPRWHLAPTGIDRMRAFARRLPRPAAIWASTECKAIEAAGLLAAHHGLPVQTHPGLNENDRSTTGFLPPKAFDAAADQFFAEPEGSFRGWERASDAQRRVLVAWTEILEARNPEAGPLAIVGHGGTGTLLFCALTGRTISRVHDAPRQGCYWTWNRVDRRATHAWQAF